MNASFDANLIVFTVPVCLVCDWYTVPAVWIDGSETGTYTSDDTFCKDVWLCTRNRLIRENIDDDLPLATSDDDLHLGSKIL